MSTLCTHVRQRNEHDIGRIGRWSCHNCHATLQGNAWHTLSWQEDCASEVVCRDRCDGKRKEKPIELSTLTRSGSATKNVLAYNDGNTG